jgi:hypothetical protein
MTIPCALCRRPFKPLRSTARFCGPRCRQTAHRRADQLPVGKSGNASEREFRSARRPSNPAEETGKRLSTKGLNSAARRLDPPIIPVHIVPDQLWPDMWRVVFSNGHISGLLNITRAKDAVARAQRHTRRSND